jgi:hypothetical protein
MIYSCWQRIERSIEYLEAAYGMSSHLSKQLLMGRTCNAYKSIADARNSNSVVSMTKTPKFVLLERDRMGELVKNNELGCEVVAEGFNGPTLDPSTEGWTAK